jgi:hypothetical protein
MPRETLILGQISRMVSETYEASILFELNKYFILAAFSIISIILLISIYKGLKNEWNLELLASFKNSFLVISILLFFQWLFNTCLDLFLLLKFLNEIPDITLRFFIFPNDVVIDEVGSSLRLINVASLRESDEMYNLILGLVLLNAVLALSFLILMYFKSSSSHSSLTVKKWKIPLILGFLVLLLSLKPLLIYFKLLRIIYFTLHIPFFTIGAFSIYRLLTSVIEENKSFIEKGMDFFVDGKEHLLGGDSNIIEKSKNLAVDGSENVYEGGKNLAVDGNENVYESGKDLGGKGKGLIAKLKDFFDKQFK